MVKYAVSVYKVIVSKKMKYYNYNVVINIINNAMNKLILMNNWDVQLVGNTVHE